jgi:AraC-like DNA-binding protein
MIERFYQILKQEQAPMDVTNHQRVEREAQRTHANREELIERIKQTLPEDGVIQLLPDLYLMRLSFPMTLVHTLIAKPALCVTVQGSKKLILGDNCYLYDPFNYLLTTVELPATGQIMEASEESPFLGLWLELSSTLVSSVLVEAGHVISSESSDTIAIDVSPLDANLLDDIIRLVRLQDSPAEAQIFMPLIKREIICRLWMSEQQGRLAHLMGSGRYGSSAVRAIEHLRQYFDQPVRIEDLAQEVGMSVSTFHRHFKAVTAMSPLQFQKQLRLQEARRLMLSEDLSAASAAYQVGYNDASHFNRDYKNFFGAPPVRDVQRLKEETGTFSS